MNWRTSFLPRVHAVVSRNGVVIDPDHPRNCTITHVTTQDVDRFSGFAGEPNMTPAPEIFRVGHGFKVLWVYTGGVPAKMVNHQPFRDRAISPLIKHSVSLLSSPAPSHLPISKIGLEADPVPTLRLWVDNIPRLVILSDEFAALDAMPGGRGLGATTLWACMIGLRHLVASLQAMGCAMARSVTALPGFFAAQIIPQYRGVSR